MDAKYTGCDTLSGLFCLGGARIVAPLDRDAPLSAKTKSGVGIPTEEAEAEELPETIRLEPPTIVAVGELDSPGLYGTGAYISPGWPLAIPRFKFEVEKWVGLASGVLWLEAWEGPAGCPLGCTAPVLGSWGYVMKSSSWEISSSSPSSSVSEVVGPRMPSTVELKYSRYLRRSATPLPE